MKAAFDSVRVLVLCATQATIRAAPLAVQLRVMQGQTDFVNSRTDNASACLFARFREAMRIEKDQARRLCDS